MLRNRSSSEEEQATTRRILFPSQEAKLSKATGRNQQVVK
jgi:hypothetical protein